MFDWSNNKDKTHNSGADDQNSATTLAAKAIKEIYDREQTPLVGEERAQLTRLLSAKLPKDAIRAESYMDAFEKKASESNGIITQRSVAKTYEQLNMLALGSSAIFSDQQRSIAALDFLRVASSDSSWQGFHQDCGVNGLNTRVMARKPELAAEMITSAALTGTWIAQDNKIIHIDADSLQPGPEESSAFPNDGDRGLSSQIFDVVSLSDVGERQKVPQQFIQHPQWSSWPFRNIAKYFDYTQEAWRLPDGREEEFAFKASMMREENRRLLGDDNVLLVNSKKLGKDSPGLAPALEQSGFAAFRTKEELQKQLEQMQSEHKLPIFIEIYNGKLPGMPYRNVPNLHGGTNHVATITRFDEAQSAVEIRSGYGSSHDGLLSLDEVFDASY